MHDEPIFRAGETVRLKRTGSLWTVCVGHRPGLPAVYQNPVTGSFGYVVSLKAQPDLLHIYPASALERMDDGR